MSLDFEWDADSERNVKKHAVSFEGERGKYAERYAAGTNVVVLAPDVAAAFPTAKSVNETLRADQDRPTQWGGAAKEIVNISMMFIHRPNRRAFQGEGLEAITRSRRRARQSNDI